MPDQSLISYLQQQIRTVDERLQRYTHRLAAKEPYPKRFLFANLYNYADDFCHKKSANKMVIMPGFRGVGKTTLMAQVCAEYKSKGLNVLFLSVEDAHNLFEIGIAELMAAYENILGTDLESLSDPLLVFLDEVQVDPKWAITLKSLYEKTTNIFFCCTGSSALILQTTTNLARRALFERIPPLSFTEYEMLKNNIIPHDGLKENLRQAVYFSKTAQEVFTKLSTLRASVNQYWTKVNKMDIKEYLAYGTLPFALMMPNETTIYDSISLLLDKIIKLDLPALGKFDTSTLDNVKRLLFIIAENEATGLAKLEKIFNLSRLTIASIFEALEKTELLIKIPAYGSNMTVAKKPYKYLFATPAIRMSFFYLTGLQETYLARQGRLFEDSVGAHLYREFILRGQGTIRYDNAQGGADFILQILNGKQLIIETSLGNKDKKQIISSMKKIKSDYNILFSRTDLDFDQDLKTISVPLDFYFLM